MSDSSQKHPLLKLADALESVNEFAGRAIAWLTLAMMFVTVTVVLLRYGFSSGSIAMQEFIMYLHATVFMIAAAYTLKHNGHVRVDILYRQFSAKTKALVDLCGTLFLLLPVVFFIAWASWDYVSVSWKIKEQSNEAGGLAILFLLKSLIPLMVILLSLQALAEIIKNALFLLGKNPNFSLEQHEELI